MFVSLSILELLFSLILQDCMAQNSHPDVHRLYLSHDLDQGLFDLDNWRIISHISRVLVSFCLDKYIFLPAIVITFMIQLDSCRSFI